MCIQRKNCVKCAAKGNISVLNKTVQLMKWLFRNTVSKAEITNLFVNKKKIITNKFFKTVYSNSEKMHITLAVSLDTEKLFCSAV
jgi:hypothetical protein